MTPTNSSPGSFGVDVYLSFALFVAAATVTTGVAYFPMEVDSPPAP